MIDAFEGTSSAIRASAAIVGAGALVSSVEWLALRSELADGGALAWKVMGSRGGLLRHRRLVRVAALAFAPPGVFVLIGLRLLAAAGAVIAAAADAGLLAPLAVLALTSVLLDARSPYTLDGSDQMTVTVSGGLAIGLACGAPEIGVGFIAITAVVSYLVAGIAKLRGPLWRGGTAVPAILSTEMFGTPKLAAVLVRRRWLGTGFTWSTISFESLFPLALFAPTAVLVAFLVAGALLHLGTAAWMGLNVFPWAFIATYPCVIWLAQQIH